MRRCMTTLVLFISLSLLTLTGSAQVETLPGLILTDMQLISQRSLPHWTPDWTGPIEGATIVAWFAEHGYPALMYDLNGDGLVDELDTIEVADDFGLGVMRTETPRGTTDVRLVVGLGQYFSSFYPNEFVLKIYDPGFPSEFAAQGYGTFAPDVIPGIVLEVLEEPSIEAYIYELSTGEGIIVGLEEGEVDRNRYLAGRSFLYEQTPDGYTPLDFAWAKENQWEEGHQGQVLETVGVMDDQFLLDFQGGWVPVEFMLALSPLVEHEVQHEEHACPEDAIAYDVTVTSLDRYGDIQIEECVIRDGDLDIYIWTVTNLSFIKDGCGLCFFQIPNPGFPTILHSELTPWNFTSAWGAWTWWLPMGNCGLQPGQSAVFMVAVPGPTVDTWVTAHVGQCMPGIGTMALLWPAATTGPGIPDDDYPGDRCPDLAIRIRDESCVYDTMTETYQMTVWADVVNVGAIPVTSSFDVLLTGTSHVGSDTTTVTIPPNLMPGGIVPVTLSFNVPPEVTGGAPCPISFELMVDSSYDIEECDEANNLAYGDVCCFGEPEQEGDCTDLTIEITDIACELNRKDGIYELTVDALVTNSGDTTITSPIWTEADSVRGSDTNVIHTDLDPGDTTTTEFLITFSINEPICPIDVVVEVDYVGFITECDETNNTDTDNACCD